MSLLEDVFLEDEAGEAQELERVIEGDEFDQRPEQASGEDSNENSEKEDEAEEDKRRVDPTSTKTKRVSKNPRVVLNPARLMGPRGIQVLPDHFKDFKFKGKGHEKEDLDLVLKKLEHWAYRLYPKFQFEDCLKKIETLGKKRPVMVHLHKIRSDQYVSDEIVVQNDSSDDEKVQPPAEEDEFDKLLQQQIELARATPAPSSAKKGFATPRIDPTFSMPKATSSPSISEEQKERMLRNRRLAEERRLARLKNTEQNNISVINEVPYEVENHYNNSNDGTNITIQNELPIDVENHQNQRKNVTIVNDVPFDVEMPQEQSVKPKNLMTIINEVPFEVEDMVQDEVRRKQNKSNVIDSSDEEGGLVVNESVTVDVHDTRVNHNMNETKKTDKLNIISSSNKELIEVDIDENNADVTAKKHKRSVIDSSDEENEEVAVNQTVSVDVHEMESCESNKDITKDDEGNVKRISNGVTETNENMTENVTIDKTVVGDNIRSEFEETSDKGKLFNINKNTEIEKDVDSKCRERGEANNHNDETDDTLQNNEENTPADNKTSDLSSNKENIDYDINQELMDVDFTEDI